MEGGTQYSGKLDDSAYLILITSGGDKIQLGVGGGTLLLKAVETKK